MTDEEILVFNRMGFIPGPAEEEDAFLSRIEKVKKKFESGEWIPASQWDWVREHLSHLFDVKPLYICAFYSNVSLAPWQGAASWMEGRLLHSVQLREGLKKGSYLGLYSREEVLAHEAVHAVRSGFEESVYEEFFAYLSSEKKWRRIFGPILQRPWEAWPLLLSLLGGILWEGFFWGTVIWLSLGFFRLIRLHRQLNRAASQILAYVGDARLTRAILFRLSDPEIAQFSNGEKIEEYEKKQTCLRWRIIRSYLKESYGKKSDR